MSWANALVIKKDDKGHERKPNKPSDVKIRESENKEKGRDEREEVKLVHKVKWKIEK